jgi:DNA-binding NarL/FixJ family response regulator
MRAAVREYLNAADRITVVGEATNGVDALAAARRLRPAVTLIDSRVSVAQLARFTSVVVLTSDASEYLVASMLQDGALGYLVHGEFEPADLPRAVRAVANGQGWLSPCAASAVTAALREHANNGRPDAPRTRFGLTTRECDILGLLSEGLSNAAIAARLDLAEKTVKNHFNRIFTKLRVRNRTAAVLMWSRGSR